MRYEAAVLRGVRYALRGAAGAVDLGPGSLRNPRAERTVTLGALDAGPMLEERSLIEGALADGLEAEVFDQAKGLPLDAGLVTAARAEEWQYMVGLEVLREATIDEALAETGGVQPLPCRWVDINKGDQGGPSIVLEPSPKKHGGARRST